MRKRRAWRWVQGTSALRQSNPHVGRGQIAALGRVLPGHQVGGEGARRAGAEREQGEDGAGGAEVLGAIEEESRDELRDRASERAERGALAEVPAPHRLGDEVRHPRDPGVVAEHPEQRGEPGDADQQRPLRLDRDREQRQQREREQRLPREPDRPERGPPVPAERGQPGRGELEQLRELRQRAQDADQQRVAAEVEAPAGDHRAAGTGGDHLGEDPLDARDAERAPKPQPIGGHRRLRARRRGAEQRARGAGDGGARSVERNRGRERGERGEEASRGGAQCGHLTAGEGPGAATHSRMGSSRHPTGRRRGGGRSGWLPDATLPSVGVERELEVRGHVLRAPPAQVSLRIEDERAEERDRSRRAGDAGSRRGARVVSRSVPAVKARNETQARRTAGE